ncbi:hypothetical protein MTR_4g104095 [Medicago truncatula]|uniref:Uncharacterized protein n=1 Tax=Medicago truncatula TaxID=3880 RepID=A0A072UPG6_MEDTR|nr:hypothetical protein MTR_4g104095 [Medicago truncatula]
MIWPSTVQIRKHENFTDLDFIISFVDAKSITSIYKTKKEYKKEKGDQTKTFSIGVKPEIGHTQPISDVLSPNEIRDNI